MSGEIVVVAVGEVQAPVLAHLCAAVARTFGQPCRVGTALPMPEHAFDTRRVQYSAQAILQQLLSGRAERVLGVVDLDLYVPGLNFVFGLADWREKRAVIALPQLGQRFYGARDDEALFLTLCHRTLPTVSRTIGLCGDCLRAHWPAVRPHVEAVQADSRAEFESARHAEEAEAAARAAGLVNVRLGNRHLLG